MSTWTGRAHLLLANCGSLVATSRDISWPGTEDKPPIVKKERSSRSLMH